MKRTAAGILTHLVIGIAILRLCPTWTDPLVDLEKRIQEEETGARDQLRQACRIPTSVRNHWTSIVKMAVLEAQEHLKEPLPNPYRDPNIPEEIIDIVVKTAKSYNIDPESFNISTIQTATKFEDLPHGVDGATEGPYIKWEIDDNGQIKFGQYEPPTLYFDHKKLPNNHNLTRAVVAHEMTHLVQCHSLKDKMENNFTAIPSQCLPYDQLTLYYNTYTRQKELTADLLPTLKDPTIAKIMLEFRKQQVELLPHQYPPLYIAQQLETIIALHHKTDLSKK